MSLCAMISTIDDAILEGDHDFTVAIDSFVPSTAVTVGGANSFDITITDAADGMKIQTYIFIYGSHSIGHLLVAGPAIINVVGDDTFSEADGTVQCCVVISGLPAGGLGCDITVVLDTTDGAGTDGASRC